MDTPLTRDRLRCQNDEFAGTAGVSSANRSLGFAPAFLDSDTGRVYRSCFRDGTPAPCHLLEGLPAALSVRQDAVGCMLAVKASVVAGFVRSGRFYTRDEALRATAEEALGWIERQYERACFGILRPWC
jgi:hypothetical protein